MPGLVWSRYFDLQVSRAPPLGDRVNTRRLLDGCLPPCGSWTTQHHSGFATVTVSYPSRKSPSVDTIATGGALDTIGLFWTAYCNYRLLNLPWCIATGTDRLRLRTDTASLGRPVSGSLASCWRDPVFWQQICSVALPRPSSTSRRTSAYPEDWVPPAAGQGSGYRSTLILEQP